MVERNPPISCANCQHALDNDQHGQEPLQSTHCTLNPVWVQVRGHHFCGQFAGGYSEIIRQPARRREYQVGERAAWREMREQQDRAIKAEKMLKEARKQIRNMKADRKGGK